MHSCHFTRWHGLLHSGDHLRQQNDSRHYRMTGEMAWQTGMVFGYAELHQWVIPSDSGNSFGL